MSYCSWDQSSELNIKYHDSEWGGLTSVKITPDELEGITETVGWCDVCKGWKEEE